MGGDGWFAHWWVPATIGSSTASWLRHFRRWAIRQHLWLAPEIVVASRTREAPSSYAAGVRVGYLVAPNVYSYVNGGYSGSEWSGTNMSTLAAGASDRLHHPVVPS